MNVTYLKQTIMSMQPLLIGLGILCASILIYKLLRFFRSATFKNKIAWIESSHLDIFRRYWKIPLIISGIGIGLAIFSATYMGELYISRRISRILLINIFTYLLIQLVKTFKEIITRYSSNYCHHQEAERIKTIVNILAKVINIVLTVIAISLILMTFPQIYEIGISILASAGIVGIVLGLSAQKSLGNILTGIQLALARSIKVGDEVLVESEMGTIEKITFTYVIMCTWDKRHLVIPVKYFIENIFQNWTLNPSNLLGTIEIEVSSMASVSTIRNAFNTILEESDLWDKKVNLLQVANIKAKTIELRGVVSAASSSNIWNLRCHVREKLLEFLQKNHPEYLSVT